ncbi:polysaccharide biosynthesis/export family protein [Maritimibacter dapengensis]|uniref:Polysaccharide export protein n=1 Tax=Maritimibacter dapengensis TaxID=2836868 RepID=A0ABS6T525_9RHOB|nr:polysaccharide biosynthesis/export family protein [Maritimibacter dapengensis]MBV7380347.1 polysaccharide export protein [Maritimibacter dapengensis]
MRRIAIALMACAALGACSLPRGAPLRSEIVTTNAEKNAGIQVVEITRANMPTISRWPATGPSKGYRWLQATGGPQSAVIRPGDQVSLDIWDSDPNSLLTAPNQKVAQMQNITVSSAGEVFVPYVGNVVINGQTPDQAREEIQQEIERISPNAQVQLSFQPGANNAVDLVSGMRNPGPLTLSGRNVTILTALAQGGGVAPNLRNPLVRVIRGGQTYAINADELFSNAAYNIVLRGGDKIFVEEDKRFFTALGATGVEAPVYFERETLTAIEAVARLRGLIDQRADPTGILILRDYPASAVTRDGKHGPTDSQVIFIMDITTADGLFAARSFKVQPGDTVMATESPAIALQTLLGIANGAALLQNRL